MFADYPPERENQRGARWNPPETPAIYASLARDVALAEAEFQISLQPVRPRARRTIYTIEIVLDSVIDLSDHPILVSVGISEDDLSAIDYRACQQVGGAIEWLGNDGLLVPSARAHGTNLVVFPNQQRTNYEFRVTTAEVVEEER